MSPAEQQPTPFNSRAEFVTRIRGFSASMRWPGYIASASMLVWFGFLFVLFIPERSHPAPRWFASYGVIAALAFFVTIAAWGYGHFRAVRRHRLLCPSCQSELIHLSARLAICTGRCSNCGSRVFPKDPTE